MGTDPAVQTARVRGAWLSEAFREGTTAAAVAENFGPELISSYGPEPTASWFVDGVDRSGWSEIAVSAGATEAVGDGGFVVRVLADREWLLQFRLEDAPPYRIAWFRPTSLPTGSVTWRSVARRLAGLDWAESSLDPVDGDAIHEALVAARDDQAVVGMLFAARETVDVCTSKRWGPRTCRHPHRHRRRWHGVSDSGRARSRSPSLRLRWSNSPAEDS